MNIFHYITFQLGWLQLLTSCFVVEMCWSHIKRDLALKLVHLDHMALTTMQFERELRAVAADYDLKVVGQ